MSTEFTDGEFWGRLKDFHDSHVEAIEGIVESRNEGLRDAATKLGKSLEAVPGNLAEGMIKVLAVASVLKAQSERCETLSALTKNLLALLIIQKACDKSPTVAPNYLTSLLCFCSYPRQDAEEIVDQLTNLGVLIPAARGKLQLDSDCPFIQLLLDAVESLKNAGESVQENEEP